ncbi:GNAT family N-acetyltransferase [Candidatus Poribacteria bacterium]|jgi:predicted GNAT family N-acyltransferase|nr:GNAT family N-acetyltransferase [Candidatus Poribacteria bacterium]MBT5533769.1 GNAT family N-acetyltransferase [Candidatus Poribacteria bacterium]MBT5709969.1 GNAT family N-acetyltransferase [Candidatus Poribacteria bacterium]MBT7101362.1 GNAT family N-acetyltransferase [Candidatus Poribacteria bacterium]MBT7805313.1 GNAT family N-acetyltransferase [Candidatus Poribacteria bacterium]
MVSYSFDRAITPGDLQPLLQQTGWAHDRDVEGIRRMLEATPVMLGAWDGDRLVGYARVVTDGVYRALIDDVVVDEPERKAGIGSDLMRRLVARLREMEIEEVLLRCGDYMEPFYAGLGFSKSGVLTMDLD